MENGTIGQYGISNIYDANYLQSLLDAGCDIKTVQNRWYEGNGWDWDGKCVGDRTRQGCGADPSYSIDGRSKVEGRFELTSVLDLCKKKGIEYQSFWTLTGSPSLLRFPALVQLARDNGLTPQQAIYRCAIL